MRTRWSFSTHGRAIIAVVALYALILQGLLAGVMPMPAPGELSPHCATQTPSSPTDQHQDHHACPCCQLAHAGKLALPPDDASALPPPSRPSARHAWLVAAPLLKTGPPSSSHSARGPPAA